ncbi:MAG: zinc-dependent metalloprotease, partial [Planctomycetota bacterium]
GAFGRDRIAPGRALAELEEVFVPVYLHHRYQVDAALKGVAGVRYFHGLNALGGEPAAPVSAEDQRAAIDVLMATIEPETLRLPRGVAELFLPRPPGFGSSREAFDRRTGVAFDWLGAADVAARVTVRGLLNGERLLRAQQQAARYATHSDLDARAILRRLSDSTGLTGDAAAASQAAEASAELGALQRVVRIVFVEEAMATYVNGSTPRQVREAIRESLVQVVGIGRLQPDLGDLHREVEALLERPFAALDASPADGAVAAPPGSPIGANGSHRCDCCFRVELTR